MSMSGVALDDVCVQKYNELKLGHSYRYIIYKIADDKKNVVVEKTAPSSADYKAFAGELPENDCRFAVFDFEWKKNDRAAQKILFIQWSPDTAPIKSKMLYAGTVESVKQQLQGIGVVIQATDAGEIAFNTVLEKVDGSTR